MKKLFEQAIQNIEETHETEFNLFSVAVVTFGLGRTSYVPTEAATGEETVRAQKGMVNRRSRFISVPCFMK